MARDIIVYLRSEGARSRVVDRFNKIVNSPLAYPSAYYGEYPMVRIRPLKSDGSPYAASDLDYDVFDFGLDKDTDLDTDPLVYSESSEVAFTVSVVTIDEKEYAEIAFAIDMWSADILALFSSSKDPSRLYAEFNAWTAGEERPALTWQFNFYALAKVLPMGTVDPPDDAPELYRLKAAQDAIDAAKLDGDVDNDTTLVDDETTPITLGAAATYNAFHITGTLFDGSILAPIDFWADHDGSDVRLPSRFLVWGASDFSAVSLSASINGSDEVQLDFTLEAHGSNITANLSIQRFKS